jgi:hypothetical protein
MDDPILLNTVGRPGIDQATVYVKEKANCSELFWRALTAWGYYDKPFEHFKEFHKWRWATYHIQHPPPTLSGLRQAVSEKGHVAIACLRDPFDRCLSMYHHYRAHFPEFRVDRETEPYRTIDAFFGAIGERWGASGLIPYAPGSRLDPHWSAQVFDGFHTIDWTAVVRAESLHTPEVEQLFETRAGIDLANPPMFTSSHWTRDLHTPEDMAMVQLYVEHLYRVDLDGYRRIPGASTVDSGIQTRTHSPTD